MNMNKNTLRVSLVLLGLFLSNMALAHSDTGAGGGFLGGFMHPLLGWDHVAAMVAVGIWGAFLGRNAIWVLPIIFPMVMALGGAIGVMGIPIPSVEIGIAASSIIIGLFIIFAVPVPLWVAGIIVAAFAIFHGHAHGTELPESANPIAYSVGFVIATGLLHLAGIALGELMRWNWGKMFVRASGGIIALVGGYFMLQAL